MQFFVLHNKVFTGGNLEGLTAKDEQCSFPTLESAQRHAKGWREAEGRIIAGYGSPYRVENVRIVRRFGDMEWVY